MKVATYIVYEKLVSKVIHQGGKSLMKYEHIHVYDCILNFWKKTQPNSKVVSSGKGVGLLPKRKAHFVFNVFLYCKHLNNENRFMLCITCNSYTSNIS